MSDTQLYRPDPAILVAPEAHSPIPLAERVEEIERVVATLATLRNERLIETPPRRELVAEQRDPVSLTAALHPRRKRSARNTKRRSSNDGTLAMRFVFFEPPNAR
jgi:hypothetical protein